MRHLRAEQLKSAGATQAVVDAALRKTIRFPRALEVQYSGFLASAQRQINAGIRERLAPLRSVLDIARSDARVERTDDLSDAITSAFSSLREGANKLTQAAGLRNGIIGFGSKTVAFNDSKYNSPVMSLLGVGNTSAGVERTIVKGWVTENTQLIRNMNAEQMGKLETLFLRSLRDGSRSNQIEADVAAILDTSVNRARLIARDQIGKLNGQLDRRKQTDAGLDSYIWRGIGDSRERPAHVAREGVVFRWDQPPSDGAPGQPVQCRCSPEPNLEPLLGPEFKAEPAEPGFGPTEEQRKALRKRQAGKRRKRRRVAAE